MPKPPYLNEFLGSIGLKTSHEGNTPKSIKKFQKKLLNPDEYPGLSSLEDSWQVLNELYSHGGEFDFGLRNDFDHGVNSSDTALSSFMFCIDSGFYPPPEVLLALESCFKTYFLADGGLELEDVFFGERKKGVGNYAALKARNQLYVDFHFKVTFSHDTNTSLEELAESMISNHISDPDIDIDSFLRGYRRWKNTMNDEINREDK